MWIKACTWSIIAPEKGDFNLRLELFCIRESTVLSTLLIPQHQHSTGNHIKPAFHTSIFVGKGGQLGSQMKFMQTLQHSALQARTGLGLRQEPIRHGTHVYYGISAKRKQVGGGCVSVRRIDQLATLCVMPYILLKLLTGHWQGHFSLRGKWQV